MNGFLEYRKGNSIFHRMNPLTKLILAVILCAVCFISRSVYYIAGIILLNILLATGAGIAKLAIQLVVSLAKFSLLLFVIQLLFSGAEGNVYFTVPLLKIPITDNGVYLALLIVLRLIAAALPLSIMLTVTQMNDLTNVLVSKLHMPYKYAFTIITVLRFIPVFSNEMKAIMEAQTARGIEFDTSNAFRKIKLIIPLCVPLLISSVKKIDSSALSAEMRGFNRRRPDSGYKKYPFGYTDAIAAAICVVVIISGIIVRGTSFV